ncbi:hypothetical protein L3X38_030818 [Prunus dulcis]|uniref:ABC1 atypical kinase-like domain-containing protein n=1 Tax=Prunus dulcis TaxID=3755 RepID=A0AAD4VCG3_PRUDU|nr:hypothetical protein L3X38_030818 [Prunus dulcis]
MSLKGLELLTKHAEPVESAPETIPEASPPVVQEKQPAEKKPLSELHTKAPEHSFAYTKKTIERAFGRKLPEIFDNFEKKPVASGSIAQGHGAGQQVKPIVVAVKQMEEAFAFWGTPEGDLVHPAECMQQLLEKVRCHRVNVDGNVCTVMVTTLVLEGWQRKLDPGYNICSCGSNHSAKVELANGCTGKRESGKSAKKPDKGRTAKEEARELQLRERRHPYMRGSEKYSKIYLPYLKHLGKCPLLILFWHTVSFLP